MSELWLLYSICFSVSIFTYIAILFWLGWAQFESIKPVSETCISGRMDLVDNAQTSARSSYFSNAFDILRVFGPHLSESNMTIMVSPSLKVTDGKCMINSAKIVDGNNDFESQQDDAFSKSYVSVSLDFIEDDQYEVKP